MANTPFQSVTSFFQNTYTQASLMGTGVLTTAVSVGVGSSPGMGLGVAALGTGAALMAHQRLSRMQASQALPASSGVAGLLQSQSEIPEDVLRSNLSDELAERYTVLGDPVFAPVRAVLTANIFKDWDAQGRTPDAAYPQLRGFVPESFIEQRVAALMARLASPSGEQLRLLEGLKLGESKNRAVRWAPRNVEDAIRAELKTAYGAFDKAEDADIRGTLAATVVKEAFRAWLKESPSVVDKPGPATPLVGDFIQASVHKLMGMLSKKTDDPRLQSLLRDLRRDERRRSLGATMLFPRLQGAVRELKSLKLMASQLSFPDEALTGQLRRALESLKDFPEAMSREDWNRFAALEGKAGDERAVRELAGRLPALDAKANETLLKEEAALAQRLRWLQAAVAGEQPVFGLEAGLAASLHPLLPEWAREATLKQGDKSWKMPLTADGKALDPALGLELSFDDGGFWLRDARGLSRLHPSNWLRAFTVNGRKIAAGGSWPVRSGDRLKVGVEVEIEFLLPEEPPLERLKLRIARIASLEDMVRFLKAEGQPSAASQIEDYLTDGEALAGLPKAGGLAAKVAELVLRREAGLLHERYFLNLSYDAAETKMIALARSVAESASHLELEKIARESGLSDAEEIAAAVNRLFNTGEARELKNIPVVFGFRDRASFFAREKEKEMRATIGALEGTVSRLTGELRDANQGIANRDQALSEGAEREKNLNRELSEARASLVEQEQKAAAEKARLLEEHAAAKRAWNEARAQLIDDHEQARLAQDAAHRVGLANQERAHGQVVARLNQEKADLEEAHRKATAEAASAHKQEKERNDAAHAEAIRLKNEEIASAKAAHQRTVANMTERHRETTEQLTGEQKAAMDQLKADHVQALANKDSERESALGAQAAAHRTAMDALEARRAEQEDRANRLAEEKAATERTLGLTKARAAAAERESADRLATIVEKDAKIAEVTGERDTFEGQAQNYQGQFESMRDENDRLLTEVIPTLERQLAEKNRELSANGAMLAEIEVAMSALETLLKIEMQVLSTDDYLARAKRIRATVEERLAEAERKQAEAEERLAAALAAQPAVPAPASDAAPVIPISHEEIPVVTPAGEPPIEEIQFEEVTDADLDTGGTVPSAAPVAGPDEVTQQIRVPVEIEAEPPPAAPAASQPTSSLQKIYGPYFGVVDPRTHKVEMENFVVEGTRDLVSMDGTSIGKASIVAGNHVQRWADQRAQDANAEAAGAFQLDTEDGSAISGKTSAGARDYQEDGVYSAHYKLPDGRTVKILAGADGAGGMGSGDLVSSSFLQAIHAAVHKAAAEGRADLTAQELFGEGEAGSAFQKQAHGAGGNSTASAGVIVILGDQATIATKGDAMVVQGRRQADGSYKAVGYSNIQHIESLGSDQLLEQVFKPMFKNPNLKHNNARCITGGVSMKGQIDIYVTKVESEDQFLIQSDGGHGNTAGNDYKINGSAEMVKSVGPLAGLTVPPLSASQLKPLTTLMEIVADKPNGAHTFHDVAAYNQTIRRSDPAAPAGPITVPVFGVDFELPAKRDPDNAFSVLFRQGETIESVATSAPANHRPLPAPVSDHFGGADARTAPAQIPVQGYLPLRGPQSYAVGGAVIAAGGVENKFNIKHPDGSLISAQTSRGAEQVSETKPQQDAYYVATYTLPDGTPVKVMVVSDGAGGMGRHGHVASSGFVQGVHAAVVEAAEAGVAHLAGAFFEAGRAGLLAQKRLHGSDKETTATASVVVIMGNTATVATLGDATVLHATAGPSGVHRTARYSQADYLEAGVMKETTGLIDETKKPHLYFIDNLAHGDFFFLGSDSQTNIHGKTYKIQASTADARKMYASIAGKDLTPPTDNTFRTMNQLLTLVNGREDAAHLIHGFVVAAMSRDEQNPSYQPIDVLGTPVAPVDVPDSDHTVVGVIQHAFSSHMGFAAPQGYAAMPEVTAITNQPVPMVDISVETNRRPEHHDRYLTVGRTAGACDVVVPHGTVSGVHGHLVFNTQANGSFEANTWYFSPITDNVNGTKLHDKKVEKGSWIPLRGGDRVTIGAVPMMVHVGGADLSLRLTTDISKVPPQLRPQASPPMPPPPSNPGVIPPMPPVPAPRQAPASPPPLPAGLQGARTVSPVPPPPPSATGSSPSSVRVSPPPRREPTLTRVDKNSFELNLLEGALVYLVSKRGEPGTRTRREGYADSYDIILENAGLLAFGSSTPLAAVYRENGSVYIQAMADRKVVLVRPDRPKEQIPVPEGRENARDVLSGSVIRIDGKLTVRINHAANN